MVTCARDSAVKLEAVLAARKAWYDATVAHHIYIREIEQGTKTADKYYDALCRDVREKCHIYRQLYCALHGPL